MQTKYTRHSPPDKALFTAGRLDQLTEVVARLLDQFDDMLEKCGRQVYREMPGPLGRSAILEMVLQNLQAQLNGDQPRLLVDAVKSALEAAPPQRSRTFQRIN